MKDMGMEKIIFGKFNTLLKSSEKNAFYPELKTAFKIA